jgi:hypothetical protein
MAVDQITPRSRRAILAGALGGLAATAASLVHAPITRAAGVDGDVGLDVVNTGAGTTEIDAGDPAFVVTSAGTAVRASGGIGLDSAGDPAVRGLSSAGVGVLGASAVAAVDIPAPIAASTGVYGVSPAGHAIYGASDTGVGVYAANNASTVAAIVAEGGPGTAIHGHADVGPAPASPGLTGIYGSAPGTGIAIAADSASGLAVKATSSLGPAIRGHGQLDGIIGESASGRSGLVGYSGSGSAPAGPAKTGVYGEATQDATARGVLGKTTAGQGVRGEATTGIGVDAVSNSGHAVDARSETQAAVFASNGSASIGSILADGGPGTAVHGHAGGGTIPTSPALTALYGSAISTGVAIAANSASGLAVKATSSLGPAIRGHGQLDGVIGESASGRSGLVGYSGAGSAPAGPAKTGVYGEATQDSGSRGVSGFTLAGQGVRGDATTGQAVAGVATTGQGVKGTATSGQGVVGQATAGVGVKAVASTGYALDVAGRARFSRSGTVSIPANATSLDVTVPGGLAGTPLVFAVLQVARTGVWVTAARPNWPTTGKIRIYLNKVASTSASTPVAWFVTG